MALRTQGYFHGLLSCTGHFGEQTTLTVERKIASQRLQRLFSQVHEATVASVVNLALVARKGWRQHAEWASCVPVNFIFSYQNRISV